MNNIPTLIGAGLGNILTPQGNGAAPQGLQGFLTLLTGKTDGTANLATDAQGLKALVEKIAAALNIDPANPELTALLQQMSAATPANTLIKPTLTSDLAASLAAQMQTPDGQPATIEQIANLLSQMEPGAGEAAIDTDVTLDPAVMTKLTDAFQKMSAEQKDGQISEKDIAQFREEAIEILKAEGFDPETIRQYMAALSNTVGIALTEAAVAPAQGLIPASQENSPLPPAPGLPAGPPPAAAIPASMQPQPPVRTPSPPVLTGKQQAGAGGPSVDTKNTKPDAMPALKGAAAAEAATATTQQKAPVTSSLALVNAMATADSEGDNSLMLMPGAAYVKSGGESQQILTNYMTAARAPAEHTVQMVALQIQRNIAAKIDTFTMQLDPADLGRLDVQMSFDKDGSMKAHMSVDRPETLAMLQRDQQHLGRILQQAGIDVDEGSLSFDLRQQNQQDLNGSRDHDNSGYGSRASRGSDDGIMQAKIAVEAMGYITQNGVDIRV